MPFSLAGKRINYKLRCLKCNETQNTTGMYLCGTCIKGKGSKIKELELWCNYLSQATGGPSCSYELIKDNSLKIFYLINVKLGGWTGYDGKDYGKEVKTILLKLLGYPPSDYSKYNTIQKPYKKVKVNGNVETVGDISADKISPDHVMPEGSNTPEPPPETIEKYGYTWYISNASQTQLDKAFKKGGGRKSKKKIKSNKKLKSNKN